MRKSLALLAVLLSIIGLALSIPLATRAGNGVQITETQVEYDYGGEITFNATFKSEEPIEPIEQVMLFLVDEERSDTQTRPAKVVSENQIMASYDTNQLPLPVFSQVNYWFWLKLQNGNTYESELFSFFYEDNRFDWETLQDEPFRVHWYRGDVAFAQEALNTARAGQTRAQSFVPLSTPENVDIYIYDNAQDLQSALNLSGQTWIAGHANPDLQTVMVSLPPGPEQQLEMERQIPHEITHVMLYHTTGSGYENLPAWFIEGLASISELYPNPDYAVLLENAYQNDSLIPMVALCKVFPRDASSALLAYAQSASFTRYLFNQFGTPGLEQLRQQYAAGLDCERGAEKSFGVSLNRLEFQWRRETFANQGLSNLLQEFGPWLFLLIVILAAPLGLIVRSLRAKPATRLDRSSAHMS